MTDWIKKMCGHRSLTSTASKADQARGECDSDISPDVEVDLIKTLLERKFNRKFQMRVMVQGYLGEWNEHGGREGPPALAGRCQRLYHQEIWRGKPLRPFQGVPHHDAAQDGAEICDGRDSLDLAAEIQQHS